MTFLLSSGGRQFETVDRGRKATRTQENWKSGTDSNRNRLILFLQTGDVSVIPAKDPIPAQLLTICC
jgi:hypothetical protein